MPLRKTWFQSADQEKLLKSTSLRPAKEFITVVGLLIANGSKEPTNNKIAVSKFGERKYNRGQIVNSQWRKRAVSASLTDIAKCVFFFKSKVDGQDFFQNFSDVQTDCTIAE